jgi:hypothetical protein
METDSWSKEVGKQTRNPSVEWWKESPFVFPFLLEKWRQAVSVYVERRFGLSEMLLREYVNGFQLQDLKKTQMKLEVIDGYILVTISSSCWKNQDIEVDVVLLLFLSGKNKDINLILVLSFCLKEKE